MQNHATREDIERVVKTIEEMGYEARPMPGEQRTAVGLVGNETITIEGIAGGVSPKKPLTIRATSPDGKTRLFDVIARVDTPQEVEYVAHGGILQYVLRQLVAA